MAETRSKTSSRIFMAGALICLLCAAVWVRLPHLEEPNRNFHGGRQFRGFLLARALYWQMTPKVSQELKTLAYKQWRDEVQLEPRLHEWLVAAGYFLLGREVPLFPLILSTFFWLAGALFLFGILRHLISCRAAFVGVTFFLFTPFAIFISTSFQPNAFGLCLLLAGLYFFVLYHHGRRKVYVWISCLLLALTALLYPILTFLVFAFLWVMLWNCSELKNWKSFLSLSCLILIPAGVYYGWPLLFHSLRETQSRNLGIVHLHLLGTSYFWVGWMNILGDVAGFFYLIPGILACFIRSHRLARNLMLGLWIGYGVQSLVFSFATPSHDYYHIPLLIPLSIGYAIFFETFFQILKNRIAKTLHILLGVMAVIACLVLAIALTYRSDRWHYKIPFWEEKTRLYEEIGEKVSHSSKTVVLGWKHGIPLRYYGQIGGIYWPYLSDRSRWLKFRTFEEEWEETVQKTGAEFFIIEDLTEWKNQKELQMRLARYPLQSESDSYLIFKLQSTSF